ncbi:MAG TPA: DUF3025 domain-containing protein [Burkholderiaceae bacterium]|nr:DUF3025 domain-containing protein [Burkholderiaceae bacterium]
MAAGGELGAIDWQAPWLKPWRATGERVAQGVQDGLPLFEALNREAGSAGAQGSSARMRFVAQRALPLGAPYESYIFETGHCPTREGLHDFFNGLCWLQFPQTKQRLNQLQARQIGAQGIGATRGAVRDALTLFDENAALLQAPPALWEALQARDWQRLFVGLRGLWEESRLVVFGHAALEKLAAPRKAITVHVYRAQFETDSLCELDAAVAANLSAAKLAGKPFAPLPVLGVPGWWAQNQDFSFYDDASVFRPRRAPP